MEVTMPADLPFAQSIVRVSYSSESDISSGLGHLLMPSSEMLDRRGEFALSFDRGGNMLAETVVRLWVGIVVEVCELPSHP
jgi:hypothetical protein